MTDIRALADYLWEAERSRTVVSPLTAAHPYLTVVDAYAVQFANVERRRQAGISCIGKKLALTTPAAQAQTGVTEPCFGHLFDEMVVPTGGTIPVSRLRNPLVEGEIALIMGQRLQGPGVTAAAVLAATRGVAPAIEIPDARGAAHRTGPDLIAENVIAALVVLGDQVTPVTGLDMRRIGMVMDRNGTAAAAGTGAAALGDPAGAVAWLANKLTEFGLALEPGEVVITGSLGTPLVPAAGDHFTARFEQIGAVSVRFSE